MRRAAFLLSSIVVFASARVFAHGGMPAQAPLITPSEACLTHDDRFELRWRDSDSPTRFGPATIDFYAAQSPIPTLEVGQTPAEGTPIARGILEPDSDNRLIWRTSTVASGHYLLWSIVREPPEEMSPLIVELSPHVVTVLHPGDRAGPSVVITRPSNSVSGALDAYELRYAACDPTGTGRVRLEAAHDGRFELLADDLPAIPDGRFLWETRGLPAGLWTLKATITDACGGAYTSYGRFFLSVLESGAGPDAGPRDVVPAAPPEPRGPDGASCAESWLPAADASPPPDATPAADAGAAELEGGEERCGCGTTRRGTPAGLLAWVIALAVLRRWKLPVESSRAPRV